MNIISIHWGAQHTDRYAWGQIAGFDNYPDSFLEIATAQIKLGSIYTPKMTIAVLRHKRDEYKFNSLGRLMFNKANYNLNKWRFKLNKGKEQLLGVIETEENNVVKLEYYNPPGGTKTCLNTKIAKAEIEFTDSNNTAVKLITKNRAAFEILTSDYTSNKD